MGEEGKELEVDIVQPDKDGKYPEVVPWQKYVGIKEAWGKTKEKVASLEDKLKQAANPEELTKVKGELDKIKTDHQKTLDELKSAKESTIAEKRTSIIRRGVPEAKAKELSEKELDTLASVLGDIKAAPKPDMSGGGGGSGGAKSSREQMRSGFDALHPGKS